MNTSSQIKQFLDFIRSAETTSRLSDEDRTMYDGQSQDILHFLELNEVPYLDRKKLTDLLPDIRRSRRVAKDTMATLAPLVRWMAEHKKAIRDLEQVLGSVRKEEDHQQNRAYSYRTDIVQQTIGHQ